MIKLAAPLLGILPVPALAASGPFFSLRNTEFVVALAFILFVAILVRFKVPSLVTSTLDKRAEQIKADLDAARELKEEAVELLASCERKHKDVDERAAAIVSIAKAEALDAVEQAQHDLKTMIARRIEAAEERVIAAEQKALKEVQSKAMEIAVAATADILIKNMSADQVKQSIDGAIAEAGTRLN